MAIPFATRLPAVAAVLERFLCPGGKLALSPYVEALQCSVLLGGSPDPKQHGPSLRAAVRQPRHAGTFDAIARRMLEMPGFGETCFAEREYLDLYLAHYLPANVGKLQLVLLDLLRAGELPEELHLIDLGTGPGTSFVAVADFVLALGAMADLAGITLPLRELSLHGLDRSPACLEYTREVLGALRCVLAGYREHGPLPPAASAGPGLTAAWDLVEQALSGVTLWQDDIGGVGPVEWPQPSLAVLSCVLTDLHEERKIEAFEARLAGLPESSRLIVLEPGQQRTASQLMRWRKSLLQRMPHLRPVLPCGQEFGTRLPASCDHCWCARREAIHTSVLQRAYLDRLDEHLRTREPQARWQVRRHFERLSWSYCVMASRSPSEPSVPDPEGAQRYLGQRRLAATGALSLAEETAPTGALQERLLAFCPARAGAKADGCPGASLVQEAGKVLPALRFGELVVLDNVDARREDGHVLFTLNRASRVRPVLADAAVAFHDPCPASLNALARRLFGFSALHDFQHRIIRRVLQRQNTLGIAATASGKTECFLLPALLLPGLTVVVSPLKSLMQDQWERCDERYGLGALTTYLNGDLDHGERLRRLRGLREGRYKLAYFTPEQLAQQRVRAALQQTLVSVLAIDEAHCVSQWGHDFRPDYLNMVRRLRACWASPPVLVALTATAGERVRKDLCHPSLLDLDNRPVEEGGDVVFHGSNRLELELIVRHESDAAARGRRIAGDLAPFTRAGADGSALVFLPYTGVTAGGQEAGECSAAVGPFAGWLERQLGQRVSTYHGQMRKEVQTEVGTFIRTRYRKDNDWGVYLFEGPQGGFWGAGRLHAPAAGVRYRLAGRWQESERYGWQFLFETCVRADGPAGTGRPLGDVTGRDRRAEQRAFMRSENRIMVATKSFGMGIDKADIRLVVHHSPPGDLLSYAQEVGRAARDGNPGRVILYYTEGSYPGGKSLLSDRHIQERFIAGRYVRESDLRACVAFLRQCRRRLEIDEPGVGRRTYALFSFGEVQAYFSDLARDPTPAGLSRPYEWPPYKERQKVVGLTLEVLFKTAAPLAGTSLLESCHEVHPCLCHPVTVDWPALEDSNAELLRETLDHNGIGQEEFETLCAEAVTGDLLPLARRLGCTVEETARFLLEASHLRVLHHLRLGKRGASADEKSWEVGLSPVLLHDEGKQLDRVIASVVAEHQRRRDEDFRDWELMLTQYVGVGAAGPPAGHCLRRVLLAFLDTGEDVVDAGCGACSACCPDGSFLPLAERAARIIAIPAALWSRLQAIRKALDRLPDREVVPGVCAFLAGEEGARWRQAVYLNAERMLREDRGGAGATALMICLIAHGWVLHRENDLHRLLDGLWQKRATLGRGLGRLAEEAAAARPRSALLAFWRARAVYEEDRTAGLEWWRALLAVEGVPRVYVHEAAAVLAAVGDLECSRLAARTSPGVEEARSAYAALRSLDLGSAEVVQDEAVAILDAVGRPEEQVDTLVGLLVAAQDRGAWGNDLVEILDAAWLWIEAALSDKALVLLLEALAGPLAATERFSSRLVGFLTQERGRPLCGAILAWCSRFVEQGGRLTDHDTSRLADAVLRNDLGQWLSCPVLGHVWDWAVTRYRPDVVRSLLSLDLSPGASVCRQSLLERLMDRFLKARPRWADKVAEALEALGAIQGAPSPNEDRLKALASRVDHCPIHAAAYVAWLEHRCAHTEEPMERRATLFRVYVRIGLVRKAAELAAAFPGIADVLGVDPRCHLAGRSRAEVSWVRLGWDDALVREFRRFLRDGF